MEGLERFEVKTKPLTLYFGLSFPLRPDTLRVRGSSTTLFYIVSTPVYVKIVPFPFQKQHINDLLLGLKNVA